MVIKNCQEHFKRKKVKNIGRLFFFLMKMRRFSKSSSYRVIELSQQNKRKIFISKSFFDIKLGGKQNKWNTTIIFKSKYR